MGWRTGKRKVALRLALSLYAGDDLPDLSAGEPDFEGPATAAASLTEVRTLGPYTLRITD